MYLYCIKTVLYDSRILSSCVSFIHGVPSSLLASLSLYSPVLALANEMASFANRPSINILVLLHTGVPMSQANKLLGASYGLYQHAKTNKTIVHTLSYALPTVLIPHVQTVTPMTFFTSAGTLQKMPRGRTVMPIAMKAKALSGDSVKVLPIHQVLIST